MNGRLENDLKREKQISVILKTLPQYVSEWNNVMIAAKNTSQSRLDFIRKIKRFLTSIDSSLIDIHPSEIKKADVDKYFSSIITTTDSNGIIKETSDSYKNSVWCCLNNFFEFLVDYGYVEKNPVNLKKRPKNNDLQRINENRIRLTEENFRDIIDAVENGAGTKKARTRQEKWQSRDMSIILLFMSTGMRETALTEINIEDIDLVNEKLMIRDKGDKVHVYYVKGKTLSSIKEWLKIRDLYFSNCETDALFLTYKGERMTSKGVSKLVKKYSYEGLGYEISPHKLRSGFCSIMYNATGDIEKTRRAVGHANITTTQRYIVTQNKEREEAANIIDSIFY